MGGGNQIIESVYERCSMSACADGVNCGVVEEVMSNMLKWFCHVEKMGSEEFVRVYESELEGRNRRERALGRQKDRVEYLGETGVLEQAKRECWDRERWRLLPWSSPKGMFPKGARHQSY